MYTCHKIFLLFCVMNTIYVTPQCLSPSLTKGTHGPDVHCSSCELVKCKVCTRTDEIRGVSELDLCLTRDNRNI